MEKIDEKKHNNDTMIRILHFISSKDTYRKQFASVFENVSEEKLRYFLFLYSKNRKLSYSHHSFFLCRVYLFLKALSVEGGRESKPFSKNFNQRAGYSAEEKEPIVTSVSR